MRTDTVFVLLILAMFVFAFGDGLYNDLQFSNRCKAAGGITTRYNTACVKPGSVLFTSN